jgi:hypothetical protein
MTSPRMIQDCLLKTGQPENWISQEILVPCLHAFSMKDRYCLKDARFVGGGTELGIDVSYYEVFGPFRERFYTGIQVKKGKIGENDAQTLITQGSKAFKSRSPTPRRATRTR